MPPEAAADLPATEQAAPAAPQSLDDFISAAMDKTEAPADPPSDPPAPAENTETGERSRDERGRFASKPPAPEASSDGATEGAAPAAPADDKGPAPTVQLPEPHARWDDARKAKFSALTNAEARQLALDIQAEHEANFTRKAQEHADYRRTADPLLQAVQPFQQYLEQVSPQIGLPPAAMIGELLKTEYMLRNGTTEQKVQALDQVVRSYGIDLAHLVGGQRQQQGQQPQADPAIINLRQQNATLAQELSAIKDAISQQQQQTRAAQDQEVLNKIAAFESAKTEDGQPRYPHYERVKGVMTQLLVDGKATTLEAAYEQAVAPINEAVAKELDQRQKAADAERQAAVEKAKKAAPVKPATAMPSGSTKGASLDALISESMSRHGIS